jgi:hypothetical protein
VTMGERRTRIVRSDYNYFELASASLLRGQRILVAELRHSPEGPTSDIADIDALIAALQRLRALVASDGPDPDGGDE